MRSLRDSVLTIEALLVVCGCVSNQSSVVEPTTALLWGAHHTIRDEVVGDDPVGHALRACGLAVICPSTSLA